MTLEELKRVLRYEEETGVFTWIDSRCSDLYGTVAGHLDKRGYWRICVFKKHYRRARLAWFYMTGEWPPQAIDHKNRDSFDDRFNNLRCATNGQNRANSKPNGRSGIKGAYLHKGKSRWSARIVYHKREIHLGTFDTAEEAGRAYAEASAKLHGEFSRP